MSNYLDIPEHTRHSLMLYVVHGYRPGRGLSYILENNLFMAVAHCDDATLAVLRPLVTWIHNFAPSDCHGSASRVDDWILREGQSRGLSKTAWAKTAWCYDTIEGLEKLGFPDEAEKYRQREARNR